MTNKTDPDAEFYAASDDLVDTYIEEKSFDTCNEMASAPFGKLFVAVLASDKIGPAAKMMYAYIQSRAFNRHSTFPSLRTVAQDVRLSSMRCQQLLKELETAGFITIKKERKPGVFYTRSIYTIRDLSGKRATMGWGFYDWCRARRKDQSGGSDGGGGAKSEGLEEAKKEECLYSPLYKHVQPAVQACTTGCTELEEERTEEQEAEEHTSSSQGGEGGISGLLFPLEVDVSAAGAADHRTPPHNPLPPSPPSPTAADVRRALRKIAAAASSAAEPERPAKLTQKERRRARAEARQQRTTAKVQAAVETNGGSAPYRLFEVFRSRMDAAGYFCDPRPTGRALAGWKQLVTALGEEKAQRLVAFTVDHWPAITARFPKLAGSAPSPTLFQSGWLQPLGEMAFAGGVAPAAGPATDQKRIEAEELAALVLAFQAGQPYDRARMVELNQRCNGAMVREAMERLKAAKAGDRPHV